MSNESYTCTDYGGLLDYIDNDFITNYLQLNRNKLIRPTFIKNTTTNTYPEFNIATEYNDTATTEQENAAYQYCKVVCLCTSIKNTTLETLGLSDDAAKIYIAEYKLIGKDAFEAKYGEDFTKNIGKLSGCYELIDRISNTYIPNLINAVKGVDTSIEFYQNAEESIINAFSAADKLKLTIDTEDYF